MDKILKIQSEIGVLSKTETNPFFKSKYMDINGLLAQLLPLLEKHEITVMQPLSNIDGKPALRTIIYDKDATVFNGLLAGKDTYIKEAKIILSEVIPLPDLQDPQKMGSAITYYRRYALQSLFLLQAQDDDGEGAKVDKKQTKKDYQAKNKADYEAGVDPLDQI